MTYRDEREALRARVENLEQELERAKGAAEEVALFPKRSPRERRARALLAGGGLVIAVGLGVGARQWSVHVARRDISVAWGRLSTCLLGEPLAPGETARSRARRIQLAYVSSPRSAEARWPGRCQQAAHRFYQELHDDGRADRDKKDAAYWSEEIAAKIERGTPDDDLFTMLDPLWKEVERSGIVPSGVSDLAAPAPASPLSLESLASAAITDVEVPTSSIHTEPFAGVERHALVDDPRVPLPTLCTITQRDAFWCRGFLPNKLPPHQGFRLLGTTDAGAAPLLFTGLDGEGGIYRGDTGELVASVRAYSAYAAADGYVAIQMWPSSLDGSFDIIEQRAPGAEVKHTTIKPEAQKAVEPTTTIHRSRLLWNKALVQMLDQNNLDASPWVAEKTLGREELGGAFHRIADLNWINTNVTGCRSERGLVARFGPSDAMLLFAEGDRWQGPRLARGLGDVLRCDGTDAVFLAGWPVRVKRCSPAGCDDATPEGGFWPTQPAAGTSTVGLEFADGKVIVAWWTERHGVRFRVGPPSRIGGMNDIVVFDDLGTPSEGTPKTGVLSGIRLLAAGHTAVLLLATNVGLRAVRLGLDGTFAPAVVAR
jgi:hypothetical protein